VVFGWEGQSLQRAECSSWQLGQHAINNGQQLRMGSSLPPLRQEGFEQQCSALVWGRDQKGQEGSELEQRWEVWPNFQHLVHCEVLDEENICYTLRFWEKRLIEGRRASASGGATVTITEVAVFCPPDSGLGLW